RADHASPVPQGLQSRFIGAPPLEPRNPVADLAVFRLPPPENSLGVLWDEYPFDELIELVQVDIREQRTGDPALRCPAERGSEIPLFEVSGLEQVLNQRQEAAVVDLLAEDRH